MSDLARTLNNRIGFHYFPDTVHYREEDLRTWIPRLRQMGAGWLVLKAPADRAIPENFLLGIIEAGITPILHFDNLLLHETKATDDLDFLLNTYQRWGIKHVCLFDRPNLIKSWEGQGWGQFKLVERFMQIFLPLAEKAVDLGLEPIFPPLEPGGDYWDTAFLRKALELINQNASEQVKNSLGYGAYAWTHNQPMNWGAGGPERWPGTKPYFTPEGEEDQRGFRIFDWYNAIIRAIFNEKKNIFLIGAGCRMDDNPNPEFPHISEEVHQIRNKRTAELLLNNFVSDETGNTLEPIPDNVVCGNFWLLTARPYSPEATDAFYPEPDEPIALVSELEIIAQRENLGAEEKSETIQSPKTLAQSKSIKMNGKENSIASGQANGIDHYLLLPLYEWGVNDWHLDVIKPFVKRHQPTIGFSLYEAMGSKNVTIVTGKGGFSEQEMEKLRSSGCKLRVISGSGTEIASKLANM